ncbi:hypothetical protein [Nitratifractor sp.]
MKGAATTFEKLLESLQPYPQMQFLLFSEQWGPLEEVLLDYAERNDHEILLYMIGAFSQDALPDSTHLNRRPYRSEQPRYNLQGKLYNHAFVLGEIPDEPEAFARKVYTGIANAGGLYLLMDRAKATDKLGDWETSLAESNYVASSTITLDDKRLLLYGRKMHGWGG